MNKQHVYRAMTALTVVGMLGLGSTVNADPVMPGDPVSGWTFDGTLEDAFGGNDGTAPNGIAYVNDGPFGGQALDLSGNTGSGDDQSYVHIGNPESLQLTTNMTVAMWIRVTGTSGFTSPIAKYDGSDGTENRGWTLASEHGRYMARLSDTGTNQLDVRPAYAAKDYADADVSNPAYINNGEWRHIALSVDDADGLAFYIDGVKLDQWHNANSANRSESVTNLFNTAADIIIGARSDLTANTFFRGQIGETAIWDQVLSDDEIAWLAQNSFATIPEPGSLGLLGAGAAMIMFRRRK